MRNRIHYYDSLRLISMLIVFTTHFIATYNPSLFNLWYLMPTRLILGGITGKAAVAMFSVILGYFASASETSKYSLLQYVIHRYLYFVICGLIINILFSSIGFYLNMINSPFNILSIIRESLLISSNIFPTFWCMKYFFIGSVICFINTKYNVSFIFVIIEIVVFILLNQVWISICLFGNVYKILCENPVIKKVFSRKIVQVILLLVGFILFNNQESITIYLIDGIFSMIILLIIQFNDPLKNLLNNRVLARVGENSMAIFLIHTILYTFIGNIVFQNRLTENISLLNILAYFLSLVLIVVLSFPLMKLLNQLNSLIKMLLNMLFQHK